MWAKSDKSWIDNINKLFMFCVIFMSPVENHFMLLRLCLLLAAGMSLVHAMPDRAAVSAEKSCAASSLSTRLDHGKALS